jgi:hypothetical protein
MIDRFMLWLAMKVMPRMTKWQGANLRLTLGHENGRRKLAMRWNVAPDEEVEVDMIGYTTFGMVYKLMTTDWRQLDDHTAANMRQLDPEGEGTRWWVTRR